MVQARVINDTTTVEVTSEQQETVVSVTSQDTVGRVRAYSSGNHKNLDGRDLPDQHPISAITGLQNALDNADKTFIYEQAIASDTWNIQHNLGKNVSIIVVDSLDRVVIPNEIVYNSVDNITISFIGALTGKAFLN